jgi:hypothetical protein
MVIKGLVPVFLLFTMECTEPPRVDCKPGNAGYYITLEKCIVARDLLPPNITQAQCWRVWGDPK